jgi:hypothetical protein
MSNDTSNYPLALTYRSVSGKCLDPHIGSTSSVVIVWNETALNKLLDAIAADPDLVKVSLTRPGG